MQEIEGRNRGGSHGPATPKIINGEWMDGIGGGGRLLTGRRFTFYREKEGRGERGTAPAQWGGISTCIINQSYVLCPIPGTNQINQPPLVLVGTSTFAGSSLI